MPDGARDTEDRESGVDAVNAAGERFRDAQTRRRTLHEAVLVLLTEVAPDDRGNGFAHAAGA